MSNVVNIDDYRPINLGDTRSRSVRKALEELSVDKQAVFYPKLAKYLSDRDREKLAAKLPAREI